MSRGLAVAAAGLGATFGAGERAVAALRGVDLAIPRGEFLAVMGPSGSGKSTLLHLLAGLRRPTTGSVRVGDVELSALGEDDAARFRRRHVGVVFQFFNLVPTLTLAQNVALPLLLEGQRLRALAPRVEELLAALRLAHRRNHALFDLSGGEVQRVAIARALFARPELLLADEPTGALDTRTAAETLDLLESAGRREGMTLVLMTHDAAAAARADRRIHLRDGAIERDEGRAGAAA